MQAAHRRAQEGRGRNPGDRLRGLKQSSKKLLRGASGSTGYPSRITEPEVKRSSTKFASGAVMNRTPGTAHNVGSTDDSVGHTRDHPLPTGQRTRENRCRSQPC